jgi:RNA polymerase sigma-70 factor, ECF subfamily
MDTAVKEAVAQADSKAIHDGDLALVEACKHGDIAAFETLVAKYDRKLLRIALRITDDLDDAQEAVQEALLKAYQKLSQFQGTSKFSTWLIRITMNECLMSPRKRNRIAQELPLEDENGSSEFAVSEFADWSPNPEQLYSRSEFREILRHALAALRPRLRAVFVLRDIEGLSINETATALGLHETAVKARLLRARLQLREELSSYFKQGRKAAGAWPD